MEIKERYSKSLHEINNINSILYGTLELYEVDRNTNLSNLLFYCDKLKRLVEKEYAFLKLGVEEPIKYVKMNKLQLLDIINLTNNEIVKGKNIEFIFESELPEDNERLYNIPLDHFMIINTNLMNNSIKAGATKIIKRYELKENKLFYFIKDNGSGMSKYQKELLLSNQKYTTSEIDKKIHGQGFNIIKQMVSDLEGSIFIRSIKNIGTEIIITYHNTKLFLE